MDDWLQTLTALTEGDLVAFDRVTCLITNHLARIGAYRHRDAWDDLVQEVLVSLLKSPPTSSESGAIVRHIQTTTYRKFVDEIRRERGRRREAPGGEGEPSSVGWRQNVSLDEELLPVDEAADWAALDGDLERALQTLDDEERAAVESRYLLGCSNTEGAARLDVSLATYKRRLSGALQRLRGVLSDPSGEPP